MKVRTKIESRHFKGLFPRGEWEVPYEPSLGLFGVWCPEGMDEVDVELVPFPYDEIPFQRGIFDPKELQRREFVFCLKSWTLEDEEGKPLKCDEKNKLFQFAHNRTFRNFVLGCIDEMAEDRGDALKNS